MCGIVAQYSNRNLVGCGEVELAASLLSHRGPDGSGSSLMGRAAVAHKRLAIVDPAGGLQPLLSENRSAVVACNGEIYNHLALRAELERSHRFVTRSDSEVVLHAYEECGPACVRVLDGMFAFFATDGKGFVASRDALGIKPLYWAVDGQGDTWCASELKALPRDCTRPRALGPGCFLTEDLRPRRWFMPAWARTVGECGVAHPADLRRRLGRAVAKRLMSDVPVGILLSGGLDSSAVAALAGRHVKGLETFSVGLDGAPDLEAAREVARFLGTRHREYRYTPGEVEAALETVIYHLESYDAALIRSAVPCYFVSRLAADHVKVVLTGEGADEVFGGYAYFAEIPEPARFHAECVRLIEGLHSMNLQRVDRMTMAHGLEGRVPFLDVDFLDWGMGLSPVLKMHGRAAPEKGLLRAAFEGLLPDGVVRRRKAEFSRGSGIEPVLAELAERVVSDRELAAGRMRFSADFPSSKEDLLYRTIFDRHFPGEAARATVGRWRPSAAHAV